jgi:cytochrome c-type biogenesis protein
MTGGTNLTILVALAAGLISFLSPCVLPLVPAYLGQLSAISVVGNESAATNRWRALRQALAFVAGFTAIFTIIGVTATYLGQGLVDVLPGLRVVGGVTLIVLGLSLAGILRLGGRLVGTNGGWLASFGLGAIFAIGWTPCIGIILGGILTMAATSGTVAQGTILLIAYCLGLGLPFVAIALAYDRAPGLLRPLLRHGRTVSLIGGLLVAAIGVAMVLDLLRLLPQYFTFNTAI